MKAKLKGKMTGVEMEAFDLIINDPEDGYIKSINYLLEIGKLEIK